MFSLDALLIGGIVAFAVGLSKTGLPGGAIVATPLIAVIAQGRGIPGTTLPILLMGDVFAVLWYREHARWDLLRALLGWILVGFAAGVAFFVFVGSSSETIGRTIGALVGVVVVAQAVKLVRARPDESPSVSTRRAAGFGVVGGFTTFVANAAGPITNAYLVSTRIDKHAFMGTSAWFYLLVNLAKIPLYLAIGELSEGGRFFTLEGLAFAFAVFPMVVAGVYAGRTVFRRIPQQAFLSLVLVFAGLGSLRLLLT